MLVSLRYVGGLADRYGARLPLVLGVGLAAQAPAVTTVALNSVDETRSGLASAINNAISQTSALLAVAVLGVLMFSVFGGNLDLPFAAVQQLEKITLGAAEVPEDLDAASSAAVERAIDEEFVSGYRFVMLVAAGTVLVSALGAALLIEDKEHEEKEPEGSAEEGAFEERLLILKS